MPIYWLLHLAHTCNLLYKFKGYKKESPIMLSLTNRFNFNNHAIAWGCTGQGKPVVLIHGTPFSSQVWRKIVPLLARTRKVYYFDLSGYGQSEKCEHQNVSLGVQNEVFMALLQHWELSAPELVAHDFGGATALRAIYLNQLKCERLTLIDPVALAPWGSPFVRHIRQYEGAFAGLPDYAHRALLKEYLQGSVSTRMSPDTLAIYMEPWQGKEGQAAFYRQISQMDQCYTDEIESLLAPMNWPVTILWGEKDEWIPIDQGVKLANKLIGSDLIRVPDSGHLMQEDAPEAIIAAILNKPLLKK